MSTGRHVTVNLHVDLSGFERALADVIAHTTRLQRLANPAPEHLSRMHAAYRAKTRRRNRR